MVCVVDFDNTYFKNDFFKERFFRKLIFNPFYFLFHLFIKKRSLVEIKFLLLNELSISYDCQFLVNQPVHQWMLANMHHYDKMVVVSASPDFFVKKLLAPLQIFDEIHGSTNRNLKGKEKLQFIVDHYGNNFDYIGDSAVDEFIFSAARKAIRVKEIAASSSPLPLYLRLIRPNNWIKNGLIFLPFLLHGVYDVSLFLQLLIGFLCFSFISSGCYLINDIIDIENDRSHPLKQRRPLAIGTLHLEMVFLLAIALIFTSLSLSAFLALDAFIFQLLYLSINYSYSTFFKKIRFLDILVLSSFYIIRIYFGSAISDTPLTGWFVATLTMAVLALSINKRYLECNISNNQNIIGRNYSKEDQALLQNLMYNFTFAAMVLLNVHAYFVLKIQTSYFYFLLNIASSAIIFFYFDHSTNQSDDPIEKVTKNKPMLIAVLFFIALYMYEILTHSAK